MDNENGNAREIRDLTAMSLAKVVTDLAYVIIPAECKLESTEYLNQFPFRKRGTFALFDAISFCAYVNKEKTGGTAIYGRFSPPKFTAIINGHYELTPGWGDHRAGFDCPLSKEWKTWESMDASARTQKQFAEFIEDNLPDIISQGDNEPTGAQMLEVASTLSAKTNVDFASAIRLQNGNVEFKFEEKTEAKTRGGFTIPEKFYIGIPVFERGQVYRIEARLRFRIDAGKLSMWYDLLRPHKVLEDAVTSVWTNIEKSTQLKIFNGSPSA